MMGWFWNWRRGYTAADMASLARKLDSEEARRIDGIIELSRGEYKAMAEVKNGDVIWQKLNLGPELP